MKNIETSFLRQIDESKHSNIPITFYENKLVGENLEDFSEAVKNIFLEKILKNIPLNSEEVKIYHRAMLSWWQQKIGIPYHLISARNEYVRKKYADEIQKEEASRIQTRLFAAFSKNDENEIAKLKSEYEKTFPDQLEGIEILFGARDFFKKSYEVSVSKDRNIRINKSEYLNLTEYQFLFTHFIMNNNHDQEFMGLFWTAMEKAAESVRARSRVQALRRGILSQVTVAELLKMNNEPARLSLPKEDAFNAIDLWSYEDTAIQIKGVVDNNGNTETEPAKLEIIEVDPNKVGVQFPAVESCTLDKNLETKNITYYNTDLQDEINKFRFKIGEYSRQKGIKINSFVIVIPYSLIDQTTGKPTPELIKQFNELRGNVPNED